MPLVIYVVSCWARYINRFKDDRRTSRVTTWIPYNMTRKSDTGDQQSGGQTTWTNTGATRSGRGQHSRQAKLATACRSLRPTTGHHGCPMMMMIRIPMPVFGGETVIHSTVNLTNTHTQPRNMRRLQKAIYSLHTSVTLVASVKCWFRCLSYIYSHPFIPCMTFASRSSLSLSLCASTLSHASSLI